MRSSGVILLYHRVNTLSPDPWSLAVTPENFAEQLAIVHEVTDVQPLSVLVRNLTKAEPGKPLSAITFDDGYADNYLQAKPLLEQAGAPGTFFINAGSFNALAELWWDALDRIFLQPGSLPERLHVNIGGHSVDLECSQASDRETAYYELFHLIRLLPCPAQLRIIEELEQWSGRMGSRPELRMMTEEELVKMNSSDLIEIGAHTLTHPVLSLLPREQQHSEIQGSKLQLERLLGSQITGFAYPNGFPADYTSETVELVRDVGFDYACAAFHGTTNFKTDRYQLPRMMVRDWNGEIFERHLRDAIARGRT